MFLSHTPSLLEDYENLKFTQHCHKVELFAGVLKVPKMGSGAYRISNIFAPDCKHVK